MLNILKYQNFINYKNLMRSLDRIADIFGLAENAVRAGFFCVLLAFSCTAYGQTVNAQLISVTGIPKSVFPSQKFSVSITVKNTGTTTWSSSGGNPFYIGAVGDDLTWGVGRVGLGDTSVPPNATHTFLINATAPQNGSHSFRWQMVWEYKTWFGPIVASPSPIKVKGPEIYSLISMILEDDLQLNSETSIAAGHVAVLGKSFKLFAKSDPPYQVGQTAKFFIGSPAVPLEAIFDGQRWSVEWTPQKVGNVKFYVEVYDASGSVAVRSELNSFAVGAHSNSSNPVPLAVEIATPHLSNPTAGTLPGRLSVGSSGDAMYVTGIVVPPGTAGIEPSISLSYSSNTPNGVIGVGWRLGGLSYIERCAKSIAQDGVNGRITGEISDRLCMDGQRLAVSGSDTSDDAYWRDGATYRTEIDTFARITRLKSGGFRVERRDGKISQYGTVQNSQLPSQGVTGITIKWALNRLEDRRGNFLLVDYESCTASGECQPFSMRYGGHAYAGVTREPDIAVVFEYENMRSDIQTAYAGGVRLDTNKRMSHIRTYINTDAAGKGGALVREYALNYTESPSSGRSQLISLELRAFNFNTGTLETLPKTVFEWQEAAPQKLKSTKLAQFVMPQFPDVEREPTRMWGNLDGSGLSSLISLYSYSCGLRSEIQCFHYPIPPHVWGPGKIRLVDGTIIDIVLDTEAAGIPTSTYHGATDTYLSDLNADGYDDIVLVDVPNKKWGYCLNSATEAAISFTCKPGGNGTPMPVDILGDHRSHVIGEIDTSGNAKDCFYDGSAMKCGILSFSGIPKILSDATIRNFQFFKISPISLGRTAHSDFYSLWKVSVPAENSRNPYSTSVNGPYDLVYGVSVCVMSSGKADCKTLYEKRSIGTKMDWIGMPTVGDINMDGLADLIFSINEGDVRKQVFCLSTEIGADCKKQENFSLVGGKYSQTSLSVGNLYGDGVARILSAKTAELGGAKNTSCRLSSMNLYCDDFVLPTSDYYEIESIIVDNSGIPAFLVKSDLKDGDQPIWEGKSLARPAAVDRIVRIVNGVGHITEIDYANGDDEEVYQRRPMINGKLLAPTFPAIYSPPSALVKEIREKSGGDELRKRIFSYGGSLADVYGRGGLGMAVMAEYEPAKMTRRTTYFSQSFPTVGLPIRELVQNLRSGRSVDLTDSVSEYVNVETSPSVPQSLWFVQKSHAATEKDLSGTLVGTRSIVVDSYDKYGNILKKTTVSKGEGGDFSTVVENPVTPDEVRWLINLPSSYAETRTAAGAPSIRREVAYEYVDENLKSETVSDGTAMNLTTSYDRSNNNFGLDGVHREDWTDENGKRRSRNVLTKTFDSKGRSTQTYSNALGHTVRTEVEPSSGLPINVQDPSGVMTALRYDAFGRRDRVISLGNNDVRTSVRQCRGDCPVAADFVEVQEIYHDGVKTAPPKLSYFNSGGNLLREASWGSGGKQIVVDYQYDEQGRLSKKYMPRFLVESMHVEIQYTYDDLDRVVETKRFDENGADKITSFVFDGPLTKRVNELGFSTYEKTDVLGRLVEVKDAIGNSAKLAYDSFDNLILREDTNKNTIYVTYDNLGRRTKLIDPDLGEIRYKVDPLGRVIEESSPEDRSHNAVTKYEYDDLDRITRRLERDLDSRWSFDNASQGSALGTGKIASATTMTNAGVDYERRYSYNSLGMVETVTRSSLTGSHSSVYQYDAWNRPILDRSISSSGVKKDFEYRYDNLGNLERLEQNGRRLWTIAERNASGFVTSTQLGNGLEERREFSEHSSQLQSITVRKNENLLVYQGVGYEKTGFVSNRTMLWGSQSVVEEFRYDPLGRMLASTINGLTEDYDYDFAGNILKNSRIGSENYGYFDQQKGGGSLPHAIKKAPGYAGNFVYDLNGNLINGANRKYEWTSFNMPAGISKTNFSSRFVYGPEHQRVRQDKIGPNGNYSIEYLGLQEVESRTGLNIKTRSYWPGGMGVDVDGSGNSFESLWMHIDHLGSVIAVSDANGSIKEQMAYNAWGKRRTLSGVSNGAGGNADDSIDGVTVNRGYTGAEMLDDLDLVHLNGRIYDPGLGRFVSADPYVADAADSQNLNRYSYVLNSPMNYIDPTGFVQQVVITGQRPSNDGGGGGGGGGGGSGGLSSILGTYSTATDPVAATVTVRGKSAQIGPRSRPVACASGTSETLCSTSFNYFMQDGLPTVVAKANGIVVEKSLQITPADRVVGEMIMWGPVSGAPIPVAWGYRAFLGFKTARRLQIASGKFDYLFGRVTSSVHNADRSKQLLAEMRHLGVPINEQGKTILTEALAKSVNTEGNIIKTFTNKRGVYEVRESLFIGPSGVATRFEATFEVLWDGTREFMTVIPFRGK